MFLLSLSVSNLSIASLRHYFLHFYYSLISLSFSSFVTHPFLIPYSSPTAFSPYYSFRPLSASSYSPFSSLHYTSPPPFLNLFSFASLTLILLFLISIFSCISFFLPLHMFLFILFPFIFLPYSSSTSSPFPLSRYSFLIPSIHIFTPHSLYSSPPISLSPTPSSLSNISPFPHFLYPFLSLPSIP